jgi:hypothetical protein
MENEISDLNDTPKTNFLQIIGKPIPPPPTTTFRPWDEKSGETINKQRTLKSWALLKYRAKFEKKIVMAKLQSTTPLLEFYCTTHKPTKTTFAPWNEKSDEPRWNGLLGNQGN